MMALFSAASNHIRPMAELTMPNKQEYCECHGYDFIHPEMTDEVMRGFERLPALMAVLKSGKYDWVWLLGCDALITNFNVKLESIADYTYGMIVTADALRVNLDSYMVSRTGLPLLERLLEYQGKPIGDFLEQSTLDHLSDTPEFYGVRKVVPQRVMNSYRYGLLADYGFLHPRYLTGTDSLGLSGEWQPGDFVFHAPGLGYEGKMAALRQMMPLIQK